MLNLNRDIEAKALKNIVIRDVVTKEENVLLKTGLFIAIGHDPSVEFIKQSGLNELLKDNGYMNVKEGRTSTIIPGMYACGDVIDHVYRQAVTAAGKWVYGST